MNVLLLRAIWIGLSAFLVSRLDINKFAMRFFRDLARSKARKRLYGNKHALVPMLLGIDKPLEKTKDDKDAEDALTLTHAELASFNGAEGSPLYLAIDGRVYDVSAGSKFYGEGGSYSSFVGTDATRAFATGCLSEECMSSSKDGLTAKELKEIDRWTELYETHDKYTFVGYLVDDPVDAVIADDDGAETEGNAA